MGAARPPAVAGGQPAPLGTPAHRLVSLPTAPLHATGQAQPLPRTHNIATRKEGRGGDPGQSKEADVREREGGGQDREKRTEHQGTQDLGGGRKRPQLEAAVNNTEERVGTG